MPNLWRDGHDRVIIAAMLAACFVLAFLQYRWTGELSRAESERLFATAGGRLQQFTRTFDTELRQGVQSLVPSSEEAHLTGPVQADEERLRSAGPRLDRPIFKRIAAAVPDKSAQLRFFEANQAEGTFTAREWPESKEWQALRNNLQRLANGGSPRGTIADPDSALIEVPVFVEGIEREWMLFEFDTDYAARVWVPELLRAYVSPIGDETFSVGVHWRSSPSRWIYGGPPGGTAGKADAEAAFFPVRFIGRGGAGGRREEEGRWLIQVTHREGSVPAAVESARLRNLAVALLLLTLIAAAGAALVRNTRQARRLAEAQYQFFAGISHELRTPLTVIQGAGHNLLSGVVQSEMERENYARAIVRQSTQLNEMVDQLLSYGTVRNAPGAAETGRTMLDVAVSEAIESAALELEQSERSVDVDMPPDLPSVRGDQGALRRVLGNLILNAIRHGGGEVKVTASQVGALVEIRVSDSGDGIPQEELSQVFDPFFRGQRARLGRNRGTGLGLSLVKETVERFGGSVAVESETGKGTVFKVRLPVAG